ncbi:MAG: hypothetical protein R3A79_07250 [Nannocystaceae bacterium]
MMIKQALAELDEVLTCFVDQEEDGCLLVACDQIAGPVLCLAIDGVDQRHPADLGVAFSGPFAGAEAFVEEAVAAVYAELRAAEAASDADADDRRLRAELSAARDPARSPADRMIALCEALCARLPEGDSRLLVGVVPNVIDDAAGYADFAAALVQARVRGLRLVLREPPGGSDGDALADASLYRHAFPLTPRGLVAHVTALADDRGAPRSQRLPSLLQLAFHHVSHGEDAQAERRFTEILDAVVGEDGDGAQPRAPAADEARAPGDAVSGDAGSGDASSGVAAADVMPLALALYGLGTLRLRRGESHAAFDRLIVAWRLLDDSAPPSLRHPIAEGLMRALSALERLPEARVFAAIAASSAALLNAPVHAAEALRTHGELDHALGDQGSARESWEAALGLLGDGSSELRRDLERRLERTCPKR